ncbi:MAG: phospho-N-acetylmuramoyl-pentapeptide-transferase [Candidatus Delongbacteria bacterium]|nr:phospho-N-acetylmuramoyl-pentapeptide-transferase [Candidatus Delongbacteria bacterium]MCG2760765.1 phospho-N-acetylmuramoyl-pentapeptide-transferase [Candidatus Delongbacteria bacterium]
MFYYLSFLSKDYSFLSFFRLFDSISFRSIGAMITALFVSLAFGNGIIKWLYRKGIRDTVREFGEIGVSDKKGTPVMGGLILILSMVVSILLWSNLSSAFTLIPLSAIIWYGLIGAKDDIDKIKNKNSDKGMSQLTKIILQAFFAVALAWILTNENLTPFPEGIVSKLTIPYMKGNFSVDLGVFYVLFVIITLLSISNAVNFADGLDGLVTVPSIVTGGVYGIFAYLIGNAVYSKYLLFNFIHGTGELTIIMAALFGAGLGFLWYNCYPATVFMGDTGSMAIGGLLGVTVILVKQELLFIVAGGIFVAEALSVLIQEKIGIRRLGRRIFFRAPIHHSFQFKGMAETKIVQRFWIVSIILALISIASIKIR